MKTRTIHRPADIVTRDIRMDRSKPAPPQAGHPNAGRGGQDHAAFGQPRIETERAKAARIFAAAKQRAAKRDAAGARADARIEARAAVSSAGYVPEDGREDVARIMVERGLSVDDAYEAWAAGSPSMSVGGRSYRDGR